MSDRYRDDPYDRTERDERRDDRTDRWDDRRPRHDDDRRRFDDRPRRPVPTGQLPDFLARRILGEGEKIESVRGPRLNPSWERYVTHPLVVGVGVLLGLAVVVVGIIAFGEG